MLGGDLALPAEQHGSATRTAMQSKQESAIGLVETNINLRRQKHFVF
jgi:hypothetical protein